MFPSLGILQHYAKFNTCTTITFKKLLGVESFRGFIGHLICHQATLPTFSSGFGLLYVI